MQKEIYLIRHGETDYNRMGLVQGSGIDAPLNALGRQQAKAFFERYRHIPFDKVYASELIRAQQTVEHFQSGGIPLEKRAELNEICWGKYEGQSISAAPKVYFDALMHRWRLGETDIPIAGGESPLDVALRQEPFIGDMMARREEKTILICMHGRAMRILLCQLLDRPLKEMEKFLHTNLSLYHLQLDSTGKASLMRENCRAHLETIGQ